MTNAANQIKEIATDVYEKIIHKKQPQLKTPLRSLQNVVYNEKDGFFDINNKYKSRTLTASTVKTFAQTLRMMALSKELIKSDDIATKREAYYVSKNWGDARFLEQQDSDTVMDDIEAMLMVNREQIGFIPEEKGGDIAGELIVIEKTLKPKRRYG
jgi:DNA topoisomerase-6 subunit A